MRQLLILIFFCNTLFGQKYISLGPNYSIYRTQKGYFFDNVGFDLHYLKSFHLREKNSMFHGWELNLFRFYIDEFDLCMSKPHETYNDINYTQVNLTYSLNYKRYFSSNQKGFFSFGTYLSLLMLHGGKGERVIYPDTTSGTFSLPMGSPLEFGFQLAVGKNLEIKDKSYFWQFEPRVRVFPFKSLNNPGLAHAVGYLRLSFGIKL